MRKGTNAVFASERIAKKLEAIIFSGGRSLKRKRRVERCKHLLKVAIRSGTHENRDNRHTCHHGPYTPNTTLTARMRTMRTVYLKIHSRWNVHPGTSHTNNKFRGRALKVSKRSREDLPTHTESIPLFVWVCLVDTCVETDRVSKRRYDTKGKEIGTYKTYGLNYRVH